LIFFRLFPERDVFQNCPTTLYALSLALRVVISVAHEATMRLTLSSHECELIIGASFVNQEGIRGRPLLSIQSTCAFVDPVFPKLS